MSIRSYILSTVAIYSVIVFAGVCRAEEIGADVVRAAIISNLEAFENLRANITVAGFNTKPVEVAATPDYTLHIRFLQKGNKERFEMSIDRKKTKMEAILERVAWDGQKCRTWLTYPNRPLDPGSGRILLKPHNYISGATAQQYFSTIGGKRWSEILSLPKCKIELTNENGKQMYHVEAVAGGPLDATRYESWHDPGQLFMPIRWKMTAFNPSDSKGKIVELGEFKVLEFQKVSGLLFPKRVERLMSDGLDEIADVAVSVNDNLITDDDFQIKWTSGAAIWDESIGAGYLVGPPSR